MDTSYLYNILNGIPPIPKCDDFTLLGAIKGKDYACTNCGKMEDEYDMSDGYIMDNQMYPKIFNESRGSTIDGNYWNWDEVHCCTNCKTIYWFRNGAY